MKEFQGHRSWNAWNVYLWIHNDEMLYRRACRLARSLGIEKGAAYLAKDMAGQKTPDRVPYTRTTILAAMRGILS